MKGVKFAGRANVASLTNAEFVVMEDVDVCLVLVAALELATIETATLAIAAKATMIVRGLIVAPRPAQYESHTSA
jgi:hypothetical protein